MSPFWISAFLDFAPSSYDEGVAFWAALTSYDVSDPRGDHGEFATLLPPDGDDFLRVQRLDDGPDGVHLDVQLDVHLDVHVDDPRQAADRARLLGASEVADHGYVAMRSPGGLSFCLVAHGAAVRPRPTAWPGGHASLLDQVCIDIPGASYDDERRFWAGLTGWEQRPSSVSEEFSSLARPAGVPLRLLFQRLGDDGPTRAHLDWATTDRAAETARHAEVGARVESVHHRWTVLADPLGRRYCITDRHPTTQMRP